MFEIVIRLFDNRTSVLVERIYQIDHWSQLAPKIETLFELHPTWENATVFLSKEPSVDHSRLPPLSDEAKG
jgi:hypothetical protein